MPRRASCQAASLPASPPPTIVTRSAMVLRLHDTRTAPAREDPGAARSSGFALVVAGLVAAEDHLALLLGLLLQEVGAAAIGAGLGNGPVIRGELALRVAAAAVERASPATLALDHLALPAFRAEQPDLRGFLLLDVFAVRVITAGDEGAETSAAPHEVLAALRAFLVDRLQLLDLQLAFGSTHEALRDLAVGVVGAGEE